MDTIEAEIERVRDVINRAWLAYRKVHALAESDAPFWRMTPGMWRELRRAKIDPPHNPVDAVGERLFGLAVRTAEVGSRELELVIPA